MIKQVAVMMVLLCTTITPVFARGGGSYSGGLMVHVQSYTRGDGTYVHSYDRHYPGTTIPRPAAVSRSSGVSTAPQVLGVIASAQPSTSPCGSVVAMDDDPAGSKAAWAAYCAKDGTLVGTGMGFCVINGL